jgi:DNA-binding transcriptional MerR regulator
MEQGYSSRSICNIIGLTYKQLDYYARTNFIIPSIQIADGYGSRRLYGFNDALQLKVVKKLLDAGVSLQKIRKIKKYLEGFNYKLQNVTILSDGSKVYLCTSAKEVYDVMQMGQGVFALALGKVLQDLQDDFKKYELRCEISEENPEGWRFEL